MATDRFVALVGDIHGDPRPLVKAAAMQGVVAVIQLGDFGLAPDAVPGLSVPLYWFEGNHERWRSVPVSSEVPYAPWCYYMPRGTFVEIGGVRFLCAGGADSVDREYQMRHGVWSDREQWSDEDEAEMVNAERADVILTHSPPQSAIAAHFDPNDLTRYFGLPNTWRSPVAHAVDRVWGAHGCPPLYCGHMHRSVTDRAVRVLNIDEIVLLPVMHPERAPVPALERSRSSPHAVATQALTPISGVPQDDSQ